MVVSVTDILVKATRLETQFPASPQVSLAAGAAFDQLLGQFAEASRPLPSAEAPVPSAGDARDTGTDRAQDSGHADRDSPPIIARDTANDNATSEQPEPPADDPAAETAERPSSSADNETTDTQADAQADDTQDDAPADNESTANSESETANGDHPADDTGADDTGLDRAADETEDLAAAPAIAAAAETQPQASAMAASVAADPSKVASATGAAPAQNGSETASTAPSPQAAPNMAANANAGPGAVTPQTLPAAANNQSVNIGTPETTPNAAAANATVTAAPHAEAAAKGITTALDNTTKTIQGRAARGTAQANTAANTATDGEGDTPASQLRANVNVTVTQGAGQQPQARGNSLLAPGTAIAGLMPLDDVAPETVLATVNGNTPAGTNAAAGSAVANGTTPGAVDGAGMVQTNTTATAASHGEAQSATANIGTASTNRAPITVSVDTSSPATIGSAANAQQTSNTAQARAMAAAARPAPVALPVVDQVAVHITKAASQGLDKINIKLSPATLGRIQVQLDIAHDGRVAVVVTAEKSETLDLLQRDARGLERALQEAGLKADSNSLDFNLRGDGHGEDTDSDNHASSGLEIASEAADGDDANVPTLAQISGYANARANIGGVDIQV